MDVPPEKTGGLEMTVSAPWSVRAVAFSRNISLWDSICSDTRGSGKGGERKGAEGDTRMSSLDAWKIKGNWLH